MKNIRTGVFETNSSSTHSICVTKNDILDQRKDNIAFIFGMFGWECEEYHSVQDKASYLYTGLYSLGMKDYLENIKRFLTNNNIIFAFEEPSEKNGYYESGYVDHANELEEFLNAVCTDEDLFMRYLFSSESFIITGNDNDDSDVDIVVNYVHDEFYKGN